MKFFRRLDLSSRTRLQMALEMRCRGSGNWGLVSDLAREYGVSRQFLCTAAKSCKLSLPVKGSAVVLMLDEVFANGEPILVVLEASSHCILDIILIPPQEPPQLLVLLRTAWAHHLPAVRSHHATHAARGLPRLATGEEGYGREKPEVKKRTLAPV